MGGELLEKKISLTFDSTAVGGKNGISKCSQNKSHKLLLTVQLSLVQTHVYGQGNKVVLNVCERTTEMRGREWFIVWGTVFS